MTSVTSVHDVTIKPSLNLRSFPLILRLVFWWRHHSSSSVCIKKNPTWWFMQSFYSVRLAIQDVLYLKKCTLTCDSVTWLQAWWCHQDVMSVFVWKTSLSRYPKFQPDQIHTGMNVYHNDVQMTGHIMTSSAHHAIFNL